jgi:hypothetical protein
LILPSDKLFVTRRRPRLAAVVASAFAALLLAGCHASATVAIQLHADGRGTVTVGVTLDHDARVALAGSASALPDVPLDDLRAHGWTVSSWRSASDGGASIELSKPFTGAAGLASVLSELDGRDGALRDAQVVRERALLRDRDGVSLLADLSHLRVGVADDAALASRLRAAGVDVGAIDKGLQSQLGTSFALSVRVTLPDGKSTTVQVAPGQQRTVSVASSVAHTGRLAALAGAALAAVLGLTLLLAASLRRRRRPRRRAPGSA